MPVQSILEEQTRTFMANKVNILRNKDNTLHKDTDNTRHNKCSTVLHNRATHNKATRRRACTTDRHKIAVVALEDAVSFGGFDDLGPLC